MTEKCFSECMTMLQAAIGRTDKARIQAIRACVGTFSDHQLHAATNALMRSWRPTAACPFPVPADFMEFGAGSSEDKAQAYLTAISKVISTVGAYKSISFGSDAVHSVVARFGGWPAICRWGQEEWNLNEGRFTAALRTALRFDAGFSGGHLAGINEQTNGYLRDSDLVSFQVFPSGRIEKGENPKLLNPVKSDTIPLSVSCMGVMVQHGKEPKKLQSGAV